MSSSNETMPASGNRIEDFAQRLEINRQYYTVQDPSNKTLAVFAEAALIALEKPYFRELVLDIFQARPDLPPPYAVKLLERVYQADLLQHDPGYPIGYRDTDAWLREFAEVNDDMLRSGVVWHSLMYRNLQSNVAERYKTIKLLTALIQERFDEPPSHLDVGSSVLHGDIKLAFNQMHGPERVPFGLIDVTDTDHERATGTPNRYLTELANTALKQQVEFGPMMGIDITDVDDPVTKQWVKSCSFYPDELLDEKRVSEYDELDRLDPHHERVQVFRGDFAAFDFRRFREVSPVETYDIITFSTVFYQVSPHERTAMLVNASQLLSPRGIIVIQDGVGGDFSKRYNYVTSVIDSTESNPSEQTLLRWETPRCQKVAPALGKISVGGKLYTFSEALELQYATER
jgi:hypothetical protein